MSRTLLSLLICFVLFGCQSSDSNVQNYPTRPITYLVPWNPGGGTDTVSRTLAAVLQNALDTPVNVVNRTGGGGVVGHLAIAQARPDGYTVGAVTVEITMMHWAGLTDLTYENYTPIALLMDNPASVTVRADAPWNTLQELVDAIEASPGTYLASGTSRGGIWDLARMGFLKAAGLPEDAMPWVPSQGAAPALQELLAGGVHVVTIALAEAEAMYRAGEVKVLAVMADERLGAFSEVPTLKEQGIDWSLGGWVSIGAPANLPETVAMRLREDVTRVAQDPAYTEPLKKAGFNLRFMTGEDFDAFLAAQDRLNGELLTESGMTATP